MLRVHVDVNGRRIAQVLIHNNGKGCMPLATYDVAVYDDDTRDMLLGMENIPHLRCMGYKTLVRKVFDRLEEVEHKNEQKD